MDAPILKWIYLQYAEDSISDLLNVIEELSRDQEEMITWTEAT